MIQIEHNLPAFSRELAKMERRVRVKAVRKSVSAAARVFRRSVRQATPVESGTLKRAIFSKRSRRSNRTNEIAYVSVRSGAKYGRLRKSGKNRDAFYWPWVEKGHLARGPGSRISGGQRTKELKRSRLRSSGAKAVAPKPFLATGFRAGQGGAVAEFAQTMATQIAEIDRTS